MISVSTIEQLKTMKFSAMARAFQQQINDPTTFSALGFEERFGLMVDAEWNKRQGNKRLRYVRDAHPDIPTACMEEAVLIKNSFCVCPPVRSLKRSTMSS